MELIIIGSNFQGNLNIKSIILNIHFLQFYSTLNNEKLLSVKCINLAKFSK